MKIFLKEFLIFEYILTKNKYFDDIFYKTLDNKK